MPSTNIFRLLVLVAFCFAAASSSHHRHGDCEVNLDKCQRSEYDADCDWEGHCLGSHCNSSEDCWGELTCICNRCAGQDCRGSDDGGWRDDDWDNDR